MHSLTTHDIAFLFLSIGILLAATRLMGELARVFHQPMVLGEILAGILLGPTVLGSLAPNLGAQLFPVSGPNSIVLNGLTTVAVALFLLVAGMELDLSMVWRQGRTAISVSLMGVIIPFVSGFLAAWTAPRLMGCEPTADPFIFALFMATALSISALPVIAKTLIDLNLYRTDLGMIIVAAAIFDDLMGWIIFAVIMGLMGSAANPHMGIGTTIWLTLGFALAVLTVGRWLVNRLLPWLQAYLSWPGGVLGFALALALLGGAFTEWIGIHAIFGAFLVGVVIGDSTHFREHTRTILHQFISFIFAPLFFGSIGLRINFIAHFDLRLTLVVLAIACLGKILGCALGARAGGLERKQAWAMGFGLNARGAMEIVLGLLALQQGLISERLFVALVSMALITSMISGPALQALLRGKKKRRFHKFISARTFVPHLLATRPYDAIEELAQAVAHAAGLPVDEVVAAVWKREKVMATGMGKGLAIPHAALPGLRAPLVGVGLSERGIDFNAPDGQPARLICLILTPARDRSAQLEIQGDIVRRFVRGDLYQQTVQVTSYTEFLALIRSAAPGHRSLSPLPAESGQRSY